MPESIDRKKRDRERCCRCCPQHMTDSTTSIGGAVLGILLLGFQSIQLDDGLSTAETRAKIALLAALGRFMPQRALKPPGDRGRFEVASQDVMIGRVAAVEHPVGFSIRTKGRAG